MRRIAYEACPLCDGERKTLAREADGRRHPLYRAPLPAEMNWLRCDDCGHVFTDGWFDAEASAHLFAKSNAFQTVGHDYERQRPIWSRVAEAAQQLAPRESWVTLGSWLDVGFGDGALLLTAKELGFSAFGLDLRGPQVAALERAGVRAECADLDSFAPPCGFDVVSLMDVLEHMPFPRPALARAAALTAPGGVLIVSCPLYASPAWDALERAGNPYWFEIEHFHNFSRAALTFLLAGVGFRIRHARVSERYRAGVEFYAQRSPV